jgi:steroid 5-alpha reductase family enzyme
MKNIIFNLLGSLIAFYIPVQIAYLTGSETVLKAVILAFVIQWVCFVPAYLLQTEKFYDLTGSVTYLTLVLFSVFSTDSMSYGGVIVCACVSVWAIRLGSFLFFRIKKDGEDKRFRSIKPNFTRFFMTWTLQGMWVTMCLLCVTTALSSAGGLTVGVGFYVGLIVFVLGFALEVVADMQKTQFRKDPKNKSNFISSGLWAKSRHPNYLGELILWVGVAIMSVQSLEGLQYITLISPLFVYVLLVYISGVRMLEDSGQKKWGNLPEYKEYLNSTPQFFISIKSLFS